MSKRGFKAALYSLNRVFGAFDDHECDGVRYVPRDFVFRDLAAEFRIADESLG